MKLSLAKIQAKRRDELNKITLATAYYARLSDAGEVQGVWARLTNDRLQGRRKVPATELWVIRSSVAGRPDF